MPISFDFVAAGVAMDCGFDKGGLVRLNGSE